LQITIILKCLFPIFSKSHHLFYCLCLFQLVCLFCHVYHFIFCLYVFLPFALLMHPFLSFSSYCMSDWFCPSSLLYLLNVFLHLHSKHDILLVVYNSVSSSSYTYTEQVGSVLTLWDFYTGGSRLESRLRHRLFWLRSFILFLSPSRRIPGYYYLD
jgi:hypothetical protein